MILTSYVDEKIEEKLAIIKPDGYLSYTNVLLKNTHNMSLLMIKYTFV
jgi:hypothetical protein